jgi:hypothetical protein
MTLEARKAGYAFALNFYVTSQENQRIEEVRPLG